MEMEEVEGIFFTMFHISFCAPKLVIYFFMFLSKVVCCEVRFGIGLGVNARLRCVYCLVSLPLPFGI